MSNPPTPPVLTPAFCFHPRLLRDFLRLSRSSIDDTISTHLNALLTPSTSSPFTPASTSTKQPPRTTRESIPNSACTPFIDSVLLPTWKSRTDVLHYCTAVATSPDPDDPDAVAREQENQRGLHRVVDERLDPYSGRFFSREARTEQLAMLLRNEEAVEGIVRHRTWGVVSERCEGLGTGVGWEELMGKWRERQPSAHVVQRAEDR